MPNREISDKDICVSVVAARDPRSANEAAKSCRGPPLLYVVCLRCACVETTIFVFHFYLFFFFLSYVSSPVLSLSLALS